MQISNKYEFKNNFHGQNNANPAFKGYSTATHYVDEYIVSNLKKGELPKLGEELKKFAESIINIAEEDIPSYQRKDISLVTRITKKGLELTYKVSNHIAKIGHPEFDFKTIFGDILSEMGKKSNIKYYQKFPSDTLNTSLPGLVIPQEVIMAEITKKPHIPAVLKDLSRFYPDVKMKNT
jgi:hypothetical protein